LLFDAEAADGAERAEFDFGFLELFEVGVAAGVEFGAGVLGSVGGEGADTLA
jgi:hypothetical protein